MAISISINQSLHASLSGITFAAQSAVPALTTDVEIMTLLPSDLGKIHRCLCDGFSTKATKVDVPLDEIALKLAQNGYRPDISLGAFHEGAMIGFWLSALRTIDDKKTAFGTGTTVLKEWRGNGIAKIMIKVALEMARQKAAGGYSLLVEASNTPAISLYRKLGFEISRRFVSYSAERPHVPFDSLRFRAEAVDTGRALEAGAIISHEEFSWYNMDEGIRDTQDSHVAAIALDEEGKESAYGIFQPSTGRVSRLDVRSMKNDREIAAIQGILSFFDRHALEGRPPEIFQVHEKSSRIVPHLRLLGFQPRGIQYEMSKRL
jgi:ribosomal protein S18 acetylase RimI-like enzyme